MAAKATTDRGGRTWPDSDRRAATVTDLRILMSRGLSVVQAAERLGVPWRTAYRWLGKAAP